VVRLGLRECRHLILAISMRNLFTQADAATRASCGVLWNHCFMTACLCRRLNRQLGFDFRGEEFTAGLLHDLGRILFAVNIPGLFRHVDPLDFDERTPIMARETEFLGTDHCRLGSHYAEQNGLPAPTVAAIRYHHQAEETPDHRKLLGLVASADHMANYLQRGEDPAAYDLSLNPGFAFLSRGLSSEKTSAIAKSIPELLSEMVQKDSVSKR
jgi:HD-like signal output (HDOD) protein